MHFCKIQNVALLLNIIIYSNNNANPLIAKICLNLGSFLDCYKNKSSVFRNMFIKFINISGSKSYFAGISEKPNYGSDIRTNFVFYERNYKIISLTTHNYILL